MLPILINCTRFTPNTSHIAHICFVQLLLQLEPRTGSADDRIPGLIPVVCVGFPDASVMAIASLECDIDSSDAQPPWGSPAVQLLHNYAVPEGRIIQLLRQGKNAATPRSSVPNVEVQYLSSCQSGAEETGTGQEEVDACKEERPSDCSNACDASFRSELNSISCTDRLADPPVFQATQIEIEGRHAVVKKVLPVPPNSRTSSRMSSRPNYSRTSSRGSASSMATSFVSAVTAASFQISGKLCALTCKLNSLPFLDCKSADTLHIPAWRGENDRATGMMHVVMN